MNSFVRRVAAVSALGLFAAGSAVVGSASAAPAVTSGPTCQTRLVGLTATNRPRILAVRNAAVVQIKASNTELAYDPTDLLPRFTKQDGNVTSLLLMAVRASGPLMILRASYSPGNNLLFVYSRTYDKSHVPFTPRLATEAPDFPGDSSYIYAVSASGTLQRWTFTPGAPQGVGTGYGDLTTLQFGGRYLGSDGKLRDILYATTAAGGLEQIQVPIQKVAQETVTKLRSTGYADVSELAVGSCNSDPNSHMVVAIRAAAKTATWTIVNRAPTATWQTTHPQGEIQPGYNWALHSVSWTY